MQHQSWLMSGSRFQSDQAPTWMSSSQQRCIKHLKLGACHWAPLPCAGRAATCHGCPALCALLAAGGCCGGRVHPDARCAAAGLGGEGAPALRMLSRQGEAHCLRRGWEGAARAALQAAGAPREHASQAPASCCCVLQAMPGGEHNCCVIMVPKSCVHPRWHALQATPAPCRSSCAWW